MTKPIKTMTFNVRAFPSMIQRHVREDLIYARNQGVDLIAWQEFWLARYRYSLARVFAKDTWGHATMGIEGTCVSWRKSRFRFDGGGSFRMHDSVPFVCSRRAGRYVRITDRQNNEKITFISAHPTPGAFSDRFSGRKKERVLAAWREGMVNLRRFILGEVRAGRTVIIGMDANATAPKVRRILGTKIFGQPVVVRTSKAKDIDHIVTVGDTTILGYWTGTDRRTNSDHFPFVEIFRIERT